MKTNLQNLEEAIEKLTQEFADKYFGKGSEIWWISGEVGGCVHINDHFFNLGDITDAIRYKASKAKMFTWYDYNLEQATKGKKAEYNFKNYLKLK